jgi:hypothetical protein
MNHPAWRAVAAMLLLFALVATAIAVLLIVSMPGALGHAVVTIDGDQFRVADLSTRPLVALLAGGAVAFILLLVVPLAVCIPLLLAGLGLAVALLAIAGSAALVLSPLLLLVWLAWRVARPGRPAA